MDAAVLRSFDQARKEGRLRGGAVGNKLYYLSAFFAHLGDRLPPGTSARLEAADGTATDLALGGRMAVLIANIDSYAAGAHPVPENRFDDGHLEVAVFNSLWQYAVVAAGSRVLPRVARWLRPWLPKYRARRLTLEFPANTPVQLDGEDLTGRLGDGRVTISFAARVNLLDLRRSFYALF
jgi:diacylglycerol kinase family enzyme